MLKLSNRSSTVLFPARKITEFFQPVTSLALRPSTKPKNEARDRRVSLDASSSSKVDRALSQSDKPTAPNRKSVGMPSDASLQQLSSNSSQSSRKRTRDGKIIERSTRSNAVDAQKAIPVTNGDIGPQQRSLLPAAEIQESVKEANTKDSQEKRSLRSKDGGTRLRSDLATYFPNFEDVVAGVPHPPDFLTLEEPIQIIESSPQESKRTSPLTRRTGHRSIEPQFERIDLFGSAKEQEIEVTKDPLNDDVFLPSHRRAERREKQLRNIEKERAQHEKGQLESLLESLQGPDWLRVMGVTGITDGARKDYEPRRDYFIREVKVLLRKFRVWKDAEKKLMLEKAAREEEAEHEDDADENEYTDADDNDISTDDPDAWAARQLWLEARSAQNKTSRPQQRSKPKEKAPPKPPKPPEPPKPFTSFFDKPHLRQAALNKGRQSGRRTILAFGHPIPDTAESEFDLPDNFMSREAMMAYARKRRRMMRERKEAENEA